jgi:hypothetical protein
VSALVGLPDETAAAVARLLGSAPVRFTPRAGGYTRAITGLAALADGRSVFVKAAAPDCPPDDPLLDDLRHERIVLLTVAETAAAALVPAVLATDEVPAPVLVLEDLAGATWPLPYPDDLEPLAAALGALAAVPPPPGLVPLVEKSGDEGWWERLAADPAPFLALGIVTAAWLDRALPGLVAAEAGAPLAGDDLVHGDLWWANLYFADRGPVVVDWGSALRGNALLDRTTVAWDLVAAGRDPGPIGFADLPRWLALIAGNQAVQATLPLGPTVAADSSLRDDQAGDLVAILPALAALLDLPPLPHTPPG